MTTTIPTSSPQKAENPLIGNNSGKEVVLYPSQGSKKWKRRAREKNENNGSLSNLSVDDIVKLGQKREADINLDELRLESNLIPKKIEGTELNSYLSQSSSAAIAMQSRLYQ